MCGLVGEFADYRFYGWWYAFDGDANLRDDMIEVKDIKYTAESKEGHTGRNVTAMVVYEKKIKL